MDDLVARLSETIIADAFDSREIMNGRLAERLIIERKEAAARITFLEAALQEIVDHVPPGSDDHAWLCAECAQRALDGEPSMCAPREVPPSMRQDPAPAKATL
jgi:hypothetical protein